MNIDALKNVQLFLYVNINVQIDIFKHTQLLNIVKYLLTNLVIFLSNK